MSRNLRIALDYAHGASLQALAEREGLSRSRIDQIVARQARGIGWHHSMLRERPERARDLLLAAAAPIRFVHVAETPEEFFFELLAERRVLKN